MSIPTQVNKRADEVLVAIINTVASPPVTLTLDTADTTFRYALDNAQGEGQPALTEIQRTVQSEPGRFYIRGNAAGGGDVHFERRNARTAPVSVATFNDTMVSLSGPHDRTHLRNRVKVTVHPRRVSATSTEILYSNQGAPSVDIGAVETITGYYNDPDNLAVRIGGMDFTALSSGTDYTMNSAEDGSGSSLTSAFDVTVEAGANSADFTITNNSGVLGYITKLQQRGKSLKDYDPYDAVASDAGSIASYGESQLTLDMPYQHGGVVARTVANFLLAQRVAPESHELTMRYVPTDEATRATALSLEPGDPITITETATGISAIYYIQHVSIRWEDVRYPVFEWLLQKAVIMPVVEGRQASFTVTNAFTHTVFHSNMGIVSGDLLIAAFCVDATPTITWPSGWTQFATGDAAGSAAKLALAYRKADGTEGSSTTVTTSTGEMSSHIVWRISGAKDPASQAPEASTVATGTSTAPNPTSLTPTGGAKAYLWIAIAGTDNGFVIFTGVPANYGSTLQTNTASAEGTSLCSAERILTASAEDPGAFTADTSEEWAAFTVAVHPQQ